MEKEEKKSKNKFLKAVAWIFSSLLILVIALLLFLRSPWGQGLIVDKAISYLSEKTNTKVSLEKAFITFSGNIEINGFYIEDQKGDTLLYSKSLEADVPFVPIIKGTGYVVNSINWSGLKANIKRKDSLGGFNYQFILDAFAPQGSTVVDTTTTSAPLKIQLGDFNFEDFKISFNDEVGGINADVQMESLRLKMEKTDLENMDFRIDHAKLKNSSIVYLQTKPFPTSEEEAAALPKIAIGNLEIENVSALYNSEPDGISTKLDIGNLFTKVPNIDLVNNIINIKEFILNDSDIILEVTSLQDQKIDEIPKDIENSLEEFIWPNWTVQIDEILLKNDNFNYLVDGAKLNSENFNPNAVSIKDLNLHASNIFLKDKNTGMQIKSLTFQENSGLDIKELALDLTASDTVINISKLQLHLNENKLDGRVVLDYKSITELINTPENIQLKGELSNFEANLKDVYLFMPELKQNEYFAALANKNLSGNFKVDGSGQNLKIENANIKWGNFTSLITSGVIGNPLNVEALTYNFNHINFRSTNTDLQKFVKEEDLGIKYPSTLSLKGNLVGDLSSLKTNATLFTSRGDVKLTGNFNFKNEIAFDAQLKSTELQLGEIMMIEQLGKLNITVNTSGKGSDINHLNANLEATIDSLTLNNYSIQNLQIKGELLDGEGPVTAIYKDSNLDIDLDGYAKLDSIASQFDVSLNVKGIDLNALGFTTRNITSALKLDASFKGDLESFRINANVTDGLAIYDNESYLLGNIGITAFVLPDSSSVDIKNKMLDLSLRSNANPTDLTTALANHFSSYLHPEKNIDTVKKPVSVIVRGKFIDAPILSDVFLTSLKELDTVNIKMDFNEYDRKLIASVNVPYIDFYGMQMDSLAFNINSDANNLKFDFGLNELNAGPLAIKKTLIDGRISDHQLNLNFSSFNEDEKIIQIKSEITEENEVLKIHLDPENLIFNRLIWMIPATNQISISDKKIEFKDFQLTHENQLLNLYSNKPSIDKDHIGINFANFTLQSFLSYLNPEKYLAKGILNGELILEQPYAETGILANLEILGLEVMEVPLGRLVLDAKSNGSNNYDFNLAIKDGNVDLDLTGDYIADAEAARLNLDLDLNKFNLVALDGFSGGMLTDGIGFISGNMKLSGTTIEPKYSGNFTFNEAGFKVAMLNAGFLFKNEEFTLNNEGAYFDNFKILDENNNDFVMSGAVYTESLINPRFDLTFDANNFRVMNSTREDNNLFFGTATLDAKAKLTGDLLLPKLDLNINVGENTNITYIIPEAELDIVERDGIVIFVNREDPDDILTKTKEESVVISGYEVNASITLEDSAVFNMIIDEETGDNIRASGEGDLIFSILPNGRTSLSGRIDISKGHYEMSLYNLVKRRFDIVEGSSVTWSGDPFDATLDATALYKVETSASALMAPQLAGADASVTNRFRQELPFYVYLNVDGELMQPVLTFSLDMPEEDQGAIGGQVYGRIQQLNQQEGELNKQVFSLLVLNRFFPESSSDGSGGGTAAIARDNLNQALSDQLNLLSGKILGSSGLELDFGLDSFTDYQGANPQDRTQLNIAAQKKLLDDRLIVRVGSNVDIQGSSQDQAENSSIIGNVSLEYLLTEDGKFRLKGFRLNRFDNVIDGQLIVSGIALIFTQEFNKFKELFEKAVKEQAQKSNND